MLVSSAWGKRGVKKKGIVLAKSVVVIWGRPHVPPSQMSATMQSHTLPKYVHHTFGCSW